MSLWTVLIECRKSISTLPPVRLFSNKTSNMKSLYQMPVHTIEGWNSLTNVSICLHIVTLMHKLYSKSIHCFSCMRLLYSHMTRIIVCFFIVVWWNSRAWICCFGLLLNYPVNYVFVRLICCLFIATACVCLRWNRGRGKTVGEQHMAKLTAWELQGTRVLIHWEVVQFKLAFCINGQPAETQYLHPLSYYRQIVNILYILNKNKNIILQTIIYMC